MALGFAEAGADIARVITANLENSGLFDPVDPDAFIERIGAARPIAAARQLSSRLDITIMLDRPRIIGNPDRLAGRVEAAHEAWIVGCNTGRAMAGIAFHRLDAAERKHEAACIVYGVGTHAQRPCDVGRVDQLARGDYADAVAQAIFDELVDQKWQRLAQHEAHVVDQ